MFSSFSSRAECSGLLEQLQKCIVALFVAAAFATGAAADPDPEVVAAVFQRVNDLRAQHGLPPLQMNDKLNQEAQAYAELLAQAAPNSFVHATDEDKTPGCNLKGHCWDGTTPGQRIQNAGATCTSWAENFAASNGSFATNPKTAVDSAMANWQDPGHLGN